MSIPGFVPGKVVGFVALTSQRRQGTRVGSSKRKNKVPFVDVVSSPIRRCFIGNIAACALITMLRPVRSDFWLAVNQSFSRLCRFPGARKQEEGKAASQRRE
jgi:hypothetical protein